MRLFIKITAVVSLLVVDLLLKNNSTVVLNTGISFGLGDNANLLWIVLHLGFILGTIFYNDHYLRLLAAFSVGNLFDRIFYGGVRDYLNIGGISFNLADLAINIVVLLFLYHLAKQYVQTQKSTK